jgi:hypothetical protein
MFSGSRRIKEILMKTQLRRGKNRLVQRQRVRMSARQKIIIGSSIVAMLTIGITIFINLGDNKNAYAAKSVGIAVLSGSWSSTATWSFSGIHRLPTCNDSVVIPAGKTVTVDNQVDLAACGSSLAVMVYGTFDFTNGFKLDLPCNSYIYIMPPTGVIKKATSGGGNSTLISICGQIEWTAGDGPLPGPDTLFYIGASGGGGTTLPVKLLYFKVKLDGEVVNFDWTTSAEINNDFFSVERSTDGEHFEPILQKDGAGNSTSNKYYSATDESPLSGFSYYRLKQTDYDGHYSYSEIETVKNGKGNEIKPGIEIKNISPNPFGESFKVSFMANGESTVDVMVMSMAGQLVVQDKIKANEGYNTWEFIDKYSLMKGIYFITLSSGDQKITTKILKN